MISRVELPRSFDTRISEWGNPVYSDIHYLFTGANQGKWNISVPWGKEINRDSPSSGERTGTSPKLCRVLVESAGMLRRRGWNPRKQKLTTDYSSRSGHEKPWLNTGGPPSKAKYYSLTDSAQVPWGKGEKNRGERSEIEPETICLQSFRALCLRTGWWTAFCIMSLRVMMSGEVNLTRSRSESEC